MFTSLYLYPSLKSTVFAVAAAISPGYGPGSHGGDQDALLAALCKRPLLAAGKLPRRVCFCIFIELS